MEIPHVNRWTAWSCVLYTFAAIPPSPSLGLFIPFFSLNKGYPGLAAMQAFLLHCLSLQALRRGAVKRRKGLVRRKMQNSTKNMKKSEIQLFNRKKQLAIFDEKLEIRERCKGVHCVDLGESFPTSIYLQNLASIQPRTSPVKFARTPSSFSSSPYCDYV